MNAKGGFAAAESYAWHRYLLAGKWRRLRPPRRLAHPCAAKASVAADYIDLLQ
jgi:aspartyl-tRNA(Asn)/glutamyl-tRNA(Gln) amidotransferase subunit A